MEAELKQLKFQDEEIKLRRIQALNSEKDSLKRMLKKVYDAWETDRYADEEFDTRKAKYESRMKDIENEIALLNQKEENIEEQVDLILELMESLNSNWFSYDFAKKASVLKLMSKEIIFGKHGKDKPLIIWELPWNALYAIGSGSNMQEWHARRDSNLRPSDS